jgi:hypothetical protein
MTTQLPQVDTEIAELIDVLRAFGPARVVDLLRRCQLPDRSVVAALRAAAAAGQVLRDGDRYLVPEAPDPTPASIAEAMFNPHTGFDVQPVRGWLDRLHEIAKDRPGEHDEWHQRHVTLRSSLLRPLYLHHRGDGRDKDIVLIGDSDLTSIAMHLVGGFRSIQVVEADESVLAFLNRTVTSLGATDVRVRHYDVRTPLPDDLRHSADVVMCDPSRRLYKKFFERATELLRPDGAFYTFVNPSHSPATGQFILQRDVIAQGWVLTDSVPVINEYVHRLDALGADDAPWYPTPHDPDDAIAFTEALVRFERGPGTEAEELVRRTTHERPE